jgi:PBP1b-binding outer membrane lipoprotein LpoB
MRTITALARILALITGAAMLTVGCSLLQPAADQAARAVTRICESTTPADRETVLAAVNAQAAPHTAHIHCKGDPQAP